jgi:hypothetical protein
MADLGLVRPRKELERLGLAEFSHEGRIKKLMPGAVPIADLLEKDPMQFANAVMEALKVNGDKVFGTGKGRKKFDPTNMGDIALAVSQITGSRTSMNELATMISQAAQVYKDSEIARKAMTPEQAAAAAANDPMGKIRTWEVELENLKQKAGKELLVALAQLAEAGKPFIDLLNNYPKLALWGMLTGRTAWGLFQMASAFRELKAANTIIRNLDLNALPSAGGAAGIGTRLGLGAGGAVAGGLIGSLLVFMGARVVNQLLEEHEYKEQAKDLGAEIARLIKEGASENIVGLGAGVDAELRRQQLKTRRQALLGKMGELGANPSTPQGQAYEKATHYISVGGAGMFMKHDPGKEMQDAARRELQQYFASLGFKSAEELTAYLQGARKSFQAQGREEGFSKYEAMLLEAYPQFASQYKTLYQVITDTSTAAQDAVKALEKINEQLRNLGEFGPIRPTPGGAPNGGTRQTGLNGANDYHTGGLTRTDHLTNARAQVASGSFGESQLAEVIHRVSGAQAAPALPAFAPVVNNYFQGEKTSAEEAQRGTYAAIRQACKRERSREAGAATSQHDGTARAGLCCRRLPGPPAVAAVE